jgi:SAM-dependent methyltransferase
MYDSIQRHLGRQVAELGSGRGNLSKYLKRHGAFLATDYRRDYLDELRERWGHLPDFNLAQLDLSNPAGYEILREFRPDTVVCMNVLEHIEDDRAVLLNLFRVLPVDARVVFLVPFNPKLTSEFDRQIGHFRRYFAGELEAKMAEAGFTVERQFYFNKVGVLAWWFGNLLCRQRTLAAWQLKLYNFLTPLFRVLDRLLPTTGLSTVVVARKNRADVLEAAA